jgi:hypothetical protein
MEKRWYQTMLNLPNGALIYNLSTKKIEFESLSVSKFIDGGSSILKLKVRDYIIKDRDI